MLRLAAFVLILTLALVAVMASDREQPIALVDAHSSGGWDFNNADYPICVTVRPAPLVPPRRDAFRPTVSEKA
jgi:hypothetical protein